MVGFHTAPERTFAAAICLLLLAAGAAPGAPMMHGKSIKQYVHQIWTSASGMPQNSGQDIVQTPDGYIWFSTQEGLARFDGVKFTVFDRMNVPKLTTSWIGPLAVDSAGGLWLHPQGGITSGVLRYMRGAFAAYDTSTGLPSNEVRAWQAGKGGTFWVGTSRGLARIEGGQVKRVYRVADGLPADTVTALGLDSRDDLWIGTTRGAARLSAGRLETLPSLRDSSVRGRFFFPTRDGTVWVPTANTLFAFKNGNVARFTARDGFPGRDLQWVQETRGGDLWFGTRHGLFRFAEGHFIPFKLSADPDVNNVLQIVEDKDGSLWLATGKGIAKVSGGVVDLYQQKDGLSDNGVNKLFIDREGNVWVGTNSGGVDRFRDEKFINYSTLTGLSYDMIQAVLEDSRGALWVGSSYGGLDRMADGTITHYRMQQGLPSNDVNGLAEDAQGRLWVSSAEGLCTIADGKVTVRRHSPEGIQGLAGPPVLQTRSGRLLVGEGSGVAEYRNGRFIPVCTTGRPLTGRTVVRQLYEDSKGTIWVVTLGEVFWLRNDTLMSVPAEAGLPAGWLQSFHEDSDGTIWAGIGGTGLVRYRNGKFTAVTPAQGLFDFMVYIILDDGRGNFWMSSNKGVYRARKEDLNDVADGTKSSLTCVAYGEADGMGSRECNGGYNPSGCRLHDGRLAFPTVRGLAIVDPADIKVNTVPPPVIVEAFRVDGLPQRVDTEVSVQPGRLRFEFQYAGISFAGAGQVHFKYQLEGMDKDWIDAGTRREAFYTHLDPGEYRFHVIAANSDGVWNDAGAVVSFRLRPYFYQSGWFIGLMVFLFLTAGPTYYFLRMRRLKLRKAELEQEVNERTTELQKTVQNLKETQHQLILSEKMASLGQLTAGIAHEIKNPLNFITNFAVLSRDLVKDLRSELVAEKDRVDSARASEIGEILDDLDQNVGKINEHGRRADSIVRGMLLHSRGKAGERQETDLNALLAEYTGLAYHGMRAQDQSFNVKIETDFDPAIGKVRVVPQDLSRAFLNIVNNACYAANDKRKSAGAAFSPTVRVSTRAAGSCIEIRIRDNGNGIPQAIKDKIFNPFFTTKPPGAGTGLGLSLTYDIITGEHKGQIAVESREGEFTEFVITLLRDAAEEGGKAA